MSPVQSNLISPFTIDGSAPPAGSMPPGAPATQSTNPMRASGSSDEVRPAWYRRANPGLPAEPPRQGEKDPFFAVIDKLIDQLDAMIGQLLGGATPGTGMAPGTGATTAPGTDATPTPGTGTATAPGNGTTTAPGTHAAAPGEGGETATLCAVAPTATLGTGDAMLSRVRNSPDISLA